MNRGLGTRDFTIKMRQDRDAINTRLDLLLPREDEPPASLHGAMRYATLSGGKRLRAIICIEAHRLFGNPRPAAALDAACAIECLHAYTLIHDDLPSIDDDPVRRGKPSCHVTFGEAVALLAGDALQALAFEVLSGCDAPAPHLLEAVKILSAAAGSRFLVGGQVADIEGEGGETTAEKMRFIHERKTAELIAASMTIGAVLAGAGTEARTAVHSIGGNVGLAFQIVDDLLDLEGKEEIVGKGLRKDSKRGKITHPACFGAVQSRREAERLIGEATARIEKLGDRGGLRNVFELVLKRLS